MHVHHRPKCPKQFLPDPTISLVHILPMAQPLLPNTGYTRGTKTKDTFLSPSSSGDSFPRPEWLTSTPAVTLMALAQLSPCFSVSGSKLVTVVLPVVKNGWTKLFLARNVSLKLWPSTTKWVGSPLGLFGARTENGCWGCQVSILRFWQNIEKQSFFSVNIPSKRQFIRLKLSKNDIFISYPTIQVRQKPRKLRSFMHCIHS